MSIMVRLNEDTVALFATLFKKISHIVLEFQLKNLIVSSYIHILTTSTSEESNSPLPMQFHSIPRGSA